MVAEVWGDRLGEAGAVGPVMAFVVTSSSNHWVENVDCFADSGITKLKIKLIKICLKFSKGQKI